MAVVSSGPIILPPLNLASIPNIVAGDTPTVSQDSGIDFLKTINQIPAAINSSITAYYDAATFANLAKQASAAGVPVETYYATQVPKNTVGAAVGIDANRPIPTWVWLAGLGVVAALVLRR